jgi:glyoxylase-like metal-dependent hydrolase (beta-lactamase superfamily II)
MNAVRQEQEEASSEITEVAPGVLRLQLPVLMPGLGHVNCYALEDERGVALVDPGLPGPASWSSLTERLDQAGIPLSRIHTVIVTHSHPDHYGGAGKLKEEAGADVVGHRAFKVWWDPNDFGDVDVEVTAEQAEARVKMFQGGRTPWGKAYEQEWRRAGGSHDWEQLRRFMGSPAPTRRLDDADVIDLAGREWVAVHTPGHTADHLCLFDPTEGVLLSGDHVLPSITPHISGLEATGDPLSLFFDSLERMHTLEGVQVVLPAHGHPFTDLDGRADAIRAHHESRLGLLRSASADLGRPATVMELSTHLFSARAQGPMADSETYAHLEHLRHQGQARRRKAGDQLLYQVESDSTATTRAVAATAD